MPPLFWLDVIALSLSAVIATSLTLMVLGSGLRRALNRSFALFTLMEAAWAAFSLLLRLTLWLEKSNPLLLSELATLTFALMGPSLLVFTVRYVGRRTRRTDLAAALGFAVIAILSIPLFRHQIIFNPRLDVNGSTTMELSSWGFMAAAVPALNLIWSLVLFGQERRRTGEPHLALSVLILMVGFVAGGLLEVRFPVLSVTNTLSVAILGYGVVSRQLFNPLRELTAELRQEITERERAEKALRDSERHYRLLAENATDVIWTVDMNLRFTYVSPSVEYIGYTVEEVTNLTVGELLTPASFEVAMEAFAEELAEQNVGQREPFDSRTLELEIKCKDGSTIRAEARTSFLRDAEGRPVGILGAARDITARKLAEERLEAERNLGRALIDNIPDSIYAKDTDSRFTVANTAVARLIGVATPDDLIGKSDFDFMPEELAAQFYADEQALVRSGQPLIDKEELNVDQAGNVRWILTTKTPLRDSQGQVVGLVGIGRDITERRQAEEALRQANLIIENSPVMLFRWEAAEGWPVVLVSENVTQIGYTSEEFLTGSVPYASIVHPEDLERVAREVQEYSASGVDRFQQEYRIVTKDGRVRWTDDRTVIERDAEGQITHYQGIVVDITERKRAEEALKSEKWEKETILDSLTQHIVYQDLEHKILWTNQAAGGSVNVAREQLIGRYCYEIWAQRSDRCQDCPVALALETGREQEVEKTTPDGRAWYIRGYPVRGPTGDIVGGIEITQDITERKRLEEQLAQAQKMEAIGRLAGGVAHDFNNLLTAIMGYTDLLLGDFAAGDPARADLEEIKKAAGRAAGLTHQLLAFSRKQMLQPQVLDLNTVVTDMEEMLRRLIGEDVDLITVLSPGLGHVKADPGQIQQVIMNLAVNSRDAMPQGGKLTIKTADVELDEAYARQHVDVQPGDYVMLVVSDTGVGMDEETQRHLFEPFFTTKETGTGLGLATVHGIVKQSGGSIYLYSEPGQGATFKIYLPRLEDGELLRTGTAPPRLPQGSETVLLVEDEDMVRELARRVLVRSGYTVLEARQADEAIRVCEEHEGPIHLMLTDVVMPGGMSGRDLAEHLAASRPEMPVLYISGYTDDAIVHHGVLDEGMAFLQKPFTPDALARKVRQVLEAVDEGQEPPSDSGT